MMIDCEEYREKYVSADADGELDPHEKRLVETHLEGNGGPGCPRCRALRDEELALKRLIRAAVPAVEMPDSLHAKVRRVLEDSPGASRRFWVFAPTRLTAARSIGMAAVVLVALIGLLILKRNAPVTGGSETPLERSVSAFEHAHRQFKPNLEGKSPDELSRQYSRLLGESIPVWDFSQAGFRMLGGRVDYEDGRPVAQTLYARDGEEILCSRFRAGSFSPPVGALRVAGPHRFYVHGGVTLCVTVEDHLVCILTTTLSAKELQTIMAQGRLSAG